jgi:Xaa-Pro dipeptidase
MPTPLSELESRLQKAQAALLSQNIDAALLVQTVDIFYFTGTAQQAHLLLPAEGEPLLLVRRDPERARAESPLAGVESSGRYSDLPPALRRLGISPAARLGLELDVLSVNRFRRYEELFPEAELVDCSPLLRQLRSIKSAWEAERLRDAGLQSGAALEAAAEFLHPGATEAEVAAVIMANLVNHGHPGLLRMRGLNTEMPLVHVFAGPDAGVASYTDAPFGGRGRTAAFPQGPSDRPINRGEAVVIDVGGSADGYISDQTRTFSLGPPAEDLARAYEFCRSLHRELAAAKPGVRCADLYELALQRARDNGYAQYFMGAAPTQVGFVGHGLGLEVNEIPVIGRGSDEVLQVGNLVALEPKVRLPGRGAVGIEDTFWVTGDGLDRLTPGDDLLREV